MGITTSLSPSLPALLLSPLNSKTQALAFVLTLAENTILTPLDSADLLNRGLLGPGRTSGLQRLHKRFLNRHSDLEYLHIPLSISLSSPVAENAFAIIPVALISYETLVYVGLTEEKAAELWSRWINWPAHGPRRETDPDDGGLIVTFKDFIFGSFENQVDTADENEQEWRACMDGCGIAIDVQDAILDPHFWDFCLSNSCLHWVKDTVRMRYAGLEEIQRSSRARTTTRTGGD